MRFAPKTPETQIGVRNLFRPNQSETSSQVKRDVPLLIGFQVTGQTLRSRLAMGWVQPDDLHGISPRLAEAIDPYLRR
jgi:hypothetical protein